MLFTLGQGPDADANFSGLAAAIPKSANMDGPGGRDHQPSLGRCDCSTAKGSQARQRPAAAIKIVSFDLLEC